ncbi:MAG: hypothetical protein AAB691_01325 [Patescibacteria group bacterium]
MITCPNCKSIDIKTLDLEFARRKKEGEAANKDEILKEQFTCQTCGDEWDSNPKSEELYREYLELKKETEMIAQDMKPGGQYKVQYIDPQKLSRRLEVARELVSSHQHTLNISPSAWHDLKQDGRI